MDIFRWLFIDQPTWVSNASNLTSITVLGALAGYYRKINCNQPKCWRIGHYKVEGTTYKTCAKHTTKKYHTKLFKKHSLKRPEQHEFLNSNS